MGAPTPEGAPGNPTRAGLPSTTLAIVKVSCLFGRRYYADFAFMAASRFSTSDFLAKSCNSAI